MAGPLTMSWRLRRGCLGLTLALLVTSCAPTPANIQPWRPAASFIPDNKPPSLLLYDKTLVYVKDKYVDAERFDPKEMLFASLKAIETTQPQVSVQEGVASGSVKRQNGIAGLRFELKDDCHPERSRFSGGAKDLPLNRLGA